MDRDLETATLAGGCFWCTEAVFQRLKGVKSVVSGYAGGNEENPNYAKVSTGTTGFAESIQIKFDPKIISFPRLLDIFWEIHNPTTPNQQGADIGPQYRSVIFYHNEQQKKIAEQSKEKMEKSGTYQNKIVTEIIPFTNFYTAEEYHQNYYEKYKNINPYCPLVVTPKIDKLIHKFNSEIKEEYKNNA